MKSTAIVKTAFTQGSGVILPCEKKIKNTFNFQKGFIVLTACHVVSDAIQRKKSIKNTSIEYNDIIALEIFDKNNCIIDNGKIDIFDIAYNYYYDICAIYFEISDGTLYSVNNTIGNVEYNNVVSITGYPSIMSNDAYSKCVTLDAKIDPTKLKDEYKHRLIIETQYNYYENLNDLELSKGVVQKRLCKPPKSGKIKPTLEVLLWQGKAGKITVSCVK